LKASSILNTIAVLVVAAGIAKAQETYSKAEAERYIKDSEAAWAASVATNDASVVKRILAEDCVWVLDGEIFTKARAVSDAESGLAISCRIILSTPTFVSLATWQLFRVARPGRSRVARKAGSSGPIHGFGAMGDGKSSRRRMFP